MSATDYPVPAWKVVLDGQDLTARIAPRLIDLTLTECRGGEADQLDLVIHDHDGRMALPKRGVTLSVAIGWQGAGLVNKGTFRVDEVEHAGAPDIITIRARSTDLTRQMRSRRERSWHASTLGAVLRNLAGEHGLKASIAAALASIAIDHLDQVNESDVALLTRLGQRYDAVATVKAGTLLFAPVGSGTTPGGTALPQARITRADGDRHRYSVEDRNEYSGCKCFWNDRKRAKRKQVLVGSDDNAFTVRETFKSEAMARQQARSKWQQLQRGAAKFIYQLALGRADLYPEQQVTVSGFKPEIDGQAWLIVQATHGISGDGGFTTALEMERVL
ncbi:phage late control D family protein [Stenotrophomonas sp. MMGLT7]|uniref:phage late control D family protein n=1 Tax=Stenotrophomonas sp. MMGLT7 TaxID=2901227 RepID=UPI001E4F3ADC|nr:phage late control D family protein [Stenotrophomonas sp. MMGLT7]MCD7096973.1 phage late control D family protein [Stenotrophomonas sp. MMGLT7]